MTEGQSIFAQLIGLSPSRISPLRRTLPRQLQNQEFLVLGTVSHDGLCPADFSREPARHREPVRASPTKLYHSGIGGSISRNTLAHANQVRDWRIYADFRVLIGLSPGLPPTTPSVWNSIKPSTRSIPPPSICVCRCFLGLNSGATKPPSNCIRCWIYAAAFRPWSL